jgi:hypothetical protein
LYQTILVIQDDTALQKMREPDIISKDRSLPARRMLKALDLDKILCLRWRRCFRGDGNILFLRNIGTSPHCATTRRSNIDVFTAVRHSDLTLIYVTELSLEFLKLWISYFVIFWYEDLVGRDPLDLDLDFLWNALDSHHSWLVWPLSFLSGNKAKERWVKADFNIVVVILVMSNKHESNDSPLRLALPHESNEQVNSKH